MINKMSWCNDGGAVKETALPCTKDDENVKPSCIDINIVSKCCPSCGHQIRVEEEQSGWIHDLAGLPAGVKFDPTDEELLEHLEGKVRSDGHNLHPLIDDFIPTLQEQNGICYTHPQKLPGVKKDGQIRHYFHRPSKAYTTGTRKRRKVETETETETRWHKTGKTRAVVGGKVRGFKKILVLYTKYGKQRKAEKTNWVMHQYHLGHTEEEKHGDLVVSKVFYQTHPRHCAASPSAPNNTTTPSTGAALLHFNYNSSSSSYISFDQNSSLILGSMVGPLLFHENIIAD